MMYSRARWTRLALLVAVTTLAEPTVDAATARRWSASTGDEFSAGTLEGTALDAEGRPTLSPEVETLWGPEQGIVWRVAPVGDGGVFVALSGPGRLLSVAPERQPEVWFDFGDENLVTALIDDGQGGAYFGVSPEGIVYHSSGPGRAEAKLTTEATFVWSLALGEDGSLWIGTGVPGRLLRSRDGKTPQVVFETGDDPVRSLAALAGGGVLVGTGGRGRVIRIDDDGTPFVLLDTEQSEVVDLVVGEDGTSFVLTAAGPKQVGRDSREEPTVQAGASERVRVVAEPPEDNGNGEQTQESRRPPPRQTLKAPDGGALYRLEADGGTRKIWETGTEMPFAMAGTPERLFVATGDAGRIHTVDGEGHSSQLLRIPSAQASAMSRAADGTILVGATSDARVVRLGPGTRRRGNYLSAVIDAGTTSTWGRVRWEAVVPRGGRIGLRARAGNTREPDETWSDWRPVAPNDGGLGGQADLPLARYSQIAVEFSSRGDDSPVLRRLEQFYQPRNRAPHVSALTVEPVGLVWVRSPAQSTSRRGPLVADDPISRQTAAELNSGRARKGAIRKAFEAGARTFDWTVDDPDSDRLTYDLGIRREGTSGWSPLATGLTEAFYSWDARGMPDGYYRVRLTASDSLDNPGDRRLTGSRVSAAFQIDNTRPSVERLRVERSGGTYQVGFVATDPGGSIAAVEVALDGGAWEPLEPVDGVADSSEERYEFEVPAANEPGAVPSLMVRVSDSSGNLGGDVWKIE